MALSWSTGIRNFIGMSGSYKRALQGGCLKIYTGAAPATADAAKSGTLLCTVSLASGVVFNEVLDVGVVTLIGSGGSVDSITVDGNEILGAVVPWNATLTATAADVAAQINKYVPPTGSQYTAISDVAVIRIYTLPGSGSSGNGHTVAATTTGMTHSEVNMGGTAGTGLPGTNGLTYGACSAGVLSKAGVWSGTNEATGVAGYYRLLGPQADGGTASTTQIRVQGVCGVASGDYPMTTTTLTLGQTHTVDTFGLTLPAA